MNPPTLEQALTNVLAAAASYRTNYIHVSLEPGPLKLEVMHSILLILGAILPGPLKLEVIEHPAESDLPTAVSLGLAGQDNESILLAYAPTKEAARAQCQRALTALQYALYSDEFDRFLTTPNAP